MRKENVSRTISNKTSRVRCCWNCRAKKSFHFSPNSFVVEFLNNVTNDHLKRNEVMRYALREGRMTISRKTLWRKTFIQMTLSRTTFGRMKLNRMTYSSKTLLWNITCRMMTFTKIALQNDNLKNSTDWQSMELHSVDW